MRTLEELLQDYFDCKKPFNRSGNFSYRGAKAYNKLVTLLYSVGQLTETGKDIEKAIRKLDEISNLNY